MLDQNLISKIAEALSIKISDVRATVLLLEDGATIPFIARYRKEKTGGLDEVQISNIHKWKGKYETLLARKETILSAIQEQDKLTDKLKKQIQNCYHAEQLEDIYLPYKRKKKTKAAIARENGLEPLALYISNQKLNQLYAEAKKYISAKVKTQAEAIEGAQHIIAEQISEDQSLREKTRTSLRKYGQITAAVVKKKKDEAAKYKDYFDFNEKLSKCPSHRYLAMMRGEQEGYLRVSLDIDHDQVLHRTYSKFVSANAPSARQYKEAILDGYKRLVYPSVQTQIRNEYKEKADKDAIEVFTKNLRQLLLAAPLGQKVTLALDPGFRTGCKTVVLDKNGNLLHSTTIYPHNGGDAAQKASTVLVDIDKKYKLDAVAIGNGTAGRETHAFVASHLPNVEIYMVNEDGASIYSASELAREEFPKEDITVRGAVSIGRRLLDPLAELVKIDAKSIGVGQYQHDVNQSQLKQALDETVISCVNSVGVNLNTASKHLLMYISGLGSTSAENIVTYRKENGNFKAKSDIKKVPRIGAKAFEQAAGFLRIKDTKNPLDNTGVHPEAYDTVMQMAKDRGVKVADLVSDRNQLQGLVLSDYVTVDLGLPTLRDIIKELEKPGLDPRGTVSQFVFDGRVRTDQDLKIGMVLPGIVTNITNFGAFVDIGIKQDGLVHISQIANKYVGNPADVLSLQQHVTVKVTEIDLQRGRISLTMKDL